MKITDINVRDPLYSHFAGRKILSAFRFGWQKLLGGGRSVDGVLS